jgi:hygromycin-B 7''-O-kinase
MIRPVFKSRQDYGSRFTDPDFWRPYVQVVCERHELPCRSVRAGVPGTHPVFIVDESFVVKFFSDGFNGGESFVLEREIYGLLANAPQIPAPSLLAGGHLFPPSDEGWNWPYLIASFIPDSSLGEAETPVAYEDRAEIAKYVGTALRHLQVLPIERSELKRNWANFLHFLRHQYDECISNHRRWATLPSRLIKQIPDYLLPPDQLIDTASTPLLLHCDLNEDHLLGEFENGRWKPTGIIDFGDAKIGDPHYEWVAVHIGLFHCDKRLLKACLESYDPAHLPDEFARRMMTFTLLHEFNVLETVFEDIPSVKEVSSLEEFAEIVWEYR